MGFLFAHREVVCAADHMFEQLEERIVLDASVDASVHHDASGGVEAHQDWNLEYSSDPSATMDHVLNAGDLDAYHGDLGTPFPSVSLGVIPPSNGASAIDLSGAVRVNGDPTKTLDVVVTYNPRTFTSAGISSLNFAQNEWTFDVTVTAPTTGVLARSWEIKGPYDSVNAILSTMQANLVPGFVGTGEIDITVTDPDHDTNVGAAPLAVQTLTIPITAGSGGGVTPGPSITAPDAVSFTAGGPATALFGGVSVTDPFAHVVDVGIRCLHGTLVGTVPASGVEVLQGPTGPDATNPAPPTGTDWVPSWLYIRGALPDVNTYIQSLTYGSLDSYGSAGSHDTLQITVDDRANASTNPLWSGNNINRIAQDTVTINYV